MRYGVLLIFATILSLLPGVVEAKPPPFGHVGASEAFEAERDLTALMVAEHVGVDVEVVLLAWEAAPLDNQLAVMRAVQQVGKSYRYASRGPNSFDCSGLMAFAWERGGVSLSANSRSQINATEPIDFARAGDLLSYPGHIMLSLGLGDWVVHAANRRTGVTISEVSRNVRAGEVLT